jgi:hypothetical protein
MDNYFKDWRSQGIEIDNTEEFLNFEKAYELLLPEVYKDLTRYKDGGWLQKYIFSYDKGYMIDENSVCDFLCWKKDTMEDDYIIDRIESPPEFFPEGLIPFATDGGGNYVCFDYRNTKENPPIVFWHHEIEKNDGIFFLNDSFEDFINNLKSEDECEE